MKRALKWVGLGLVALVGVLGVVGLFLPRQWQVERSALFQAAPEDIHPLVDDLKAWQSWAAWNNRMDPDVKLQYSDVASGVGAWWTWNGPKMGHGKMIITRSDVASGVWVDEMIEQQDAVNAHASITWTREGEGMRVTWRDEGQLPPVIGGYFVGYINTMLGEHFQKGLTGLQAEAQKRHAARKAAAQPPDATASPAVP